MGRGVAVEEEWRISKRCIVIVGDGWTRSGIDGYHVYVVVVVLICWIRCCVIGFPIMFVIIIVGTIGIAIIVIFVIVGEEGSVFTS
jgi:hypothetical protein